MLSEDMLRSWTMLTELNAGNHVLQNLIVLCGFSPLINYVTKEKRKNEK